MMGRVFSPPFSRVGSLVGRQTPVPNCQFNKESTFFLDSQYARTVALVENLGSFRAMNREKRPLVEVQNCMKITNHSKRIFEIYHNLN
jgi:hypothetical protein